MDDDNSKAANVCRDWGVKNGKKTKVGKWSGSGKNRARLYHYIVFVWESYHWLILPKSSGRQRAKVECDDYLEGVSAGDFWKIYVR